MAREAHGPAAARREPSRWFVVGAILAWLAAAAGGLGLLSYYSSIPGGAVQSASARWPVATTLELARGRHTLVMAAHPHCACTRASIEELAGLATRLRGRLSTYVLFLKASELGADWERTDLWKRVSALDGVTVIADHEGKEAARFGALTSGQTYLFDSAGRLQFQGGITPSRSHQGDNVGRQRILALVQGGAVERAKSAVYGCALSEQSNDDIWFSWLRRSRPSEAAGMKR